MNCPRCQQPLPDPPERYCPNCGFELAGGPAATLAGGVPPPYGVPPPPPAGSPWERRNRIGFFTALIETTQQALTQPSAFFRAMSPTGGVGSPLLYAVVVGYFGAVVEALYNFVAYALMPGGFGAFGRSPEMEKLRPFLEGPGPLVATLVLGPVIVALKVFLWSVVLHVILALLGGARRGFEATCRTVCYAEATSLIKIIPFCGWIVAFIYVLAVLSIGLAEAHGTTRGKAAAAVMLPLLLCCCCLAVLFGLGIMAGVSALGQR
jgi:hypothetical protein